MNNFRESFITFIGLFASVSTILCCALPIILVMLGMGAVFASLTSSFPLLTWLAERFIYLFLISSFLLTLSGYLIFIKPNYCPTEPKAAKLCQKLKKINKIVWWFSLTTLITSLFFKYALLWFI
jgi:mercuric ion transport protein